MSENDQAPTSITFNTKRSLSFNGKEVAISPESDISGRYLNKTYSSREINHNAGNISTTEEVTTDSKPVPAPRLMRRPSSVGMKFKKPTLTAYDLEPTGPPDRTYKVSIRLW